ncbi:RNA-directed RNA polymerase 2 [Desarmillaria tabescens]|uniref:RNA-dependent RNA polymerase n=1 Tax=Armillaria tabescens TaxID=1929756 RepID=A0AA39NGV3_ARMTA|nr:RNA-directed RNA polymerase 2 [Desarmillaria tabescens]KAK0465407.1 RNA-directed RNA polymerase 2 [Desarmillaria tabescens]
MEFIMKNINFSSTTNDIIIGLAEILHGPSYTTFSEVPLNFHVRLFKDKKGTKKHGGSGALTLPTTSVGDEFLREYGEQGRKKFSVGSRQVKFCVSRKGPRADIVDSITRTPYLDPRAVEEQNWRTSKLQRESVLIRTIQFGWDCRDYIFSIEWEKTFPTSCCTLSFDNERREIRIKIADTSPSLAIVTRLSNIVEVSVHQYLTFHVIFFSFSVPPSFEEEYKPRRRLHALPIDDHHIVAPFTSHSLRLLCDNVDELHKFLDLSHTAQFHNISNKEYPADRRGLFSSHLLDDLAQWQRYFHWSIAFQVEALVRNLVLDAKEMLRLMPDIQRMFLVEGKDYTASFLRYFRPRAEALFYDETSLSAETDDVVRQCFLLAEQDYKTQARAPSLKPTDGSLFESLHIVITPTRMILDGPYPERSNRVIRTYSSANHESFLRVSFAEEDRLQYRFDREVDGPALIRLRVGTFLLDGLHIALRKFTFLAYSQSALKEHSVWFVKPFREKGVLVDAPTIISSLGTFDGELVRCPARYAARLSQAFTATDATVTEIEEIIRIPDIENDKYCFTDGVGTLSLEMARDIWSDLKSLKQRRRKNRTPPRAFQVRFMGSKGMLSVDYKLQGKTVCLRPSMIKFEGTESRNVEIARAFDKPGLYYLNRPLIMLLEGLGVPYEIFKEYQDKAVQEVHEARETLEKAARMLESFGLGASYRITSVLLGLHRLGVDSMFDNEFYQKMMTVATYDVLRLLRNHARIPIPGAWTLVGVADIHHALKEDEIFACIKPQDSSRRIYLEGPVLISRSPTIHPGDVRVVYAIGAPPEGSPFAAESLPNTVVFSTSGPRPLPSMLGGGDLDGDLYNLIPLDSMPKFRPTKSHHPAQYDPAPKHLLDRPSTMADVAEFVMEYINSDVLGIIAINWLVIADQSPQGVFDPDCIKLSALHSDAVDYPKSGQPVALDAIPKLKFRAKPDWNAPETVGPSSTNYYQSTRAIGRLFRAIELPAIETTPNRKRRTKGSGARNVDAGHQNLDDISDALSNLDFEDDPILAEIEERVSQFIDTTGASQEELEYLVRIFRRYQAELQGICASYTLSHRGGMLSEEEVVIGAITQKTSQPRKRKDLTAKLREQTDVLVRGVREELGGDEDVPLEEALQRGWLAWELSLTEQKSFGAQSFGLVALGSIFEAIREIEERVREDMRNRGY